MHAYPPEYDDPCVANISAPELPDWLDPDIYWDEDGRVFVMRKDNGEQITLEVNFEPTDNEEADYAAIKAQVLARFNTDSTVLSALASELEEAFSASQVHALAAMPTFYEFWDDIRDYVGVGCESAGDWTPFWNGDEWYTQSECIEYEVDEDDCYVVVRVCDEDGNWNSSHYTAKEWALCYTNHIITDTHFVMWGRYHLWGIENGGIDPLNTWDATPTVQRHIDAVHEQIKYLRMSLPHAIIEYATDSNN